MSTTDQTEIWCKICGQKHPLSLLENLMEADGWVVDDHFPDSDYYCGACRVYKDKPLPRGWGRSKL